MTDSRLVIPVPRGEDDEPPVLQVVATDVMEGLAVVEVRGDLDTLTATGFDRWVREQLEGTPTSCSISIMSRSWRPPASRR